MSPFFWKGGPWNKGPDFGLHKFASLNRKARRKAPLLEGRSKQDRIMPAVQNFGVYVRVVKGCEGLHCYIRSK